MVLDPAATAITADLAPAPGGATDMSKVTKIDLEKLPEGFRLLRRPRELIGMASRPTCAGPLGHPGARRRSADMPLRSAPLEPA